MRFFVCVFFFLVFFLVSFLNGQFAGDALIVLWPPPTRDSVTDAVSRETTERDDSAEVRHEWNSRGGGNYEGREQGGEGAPYTLLRRLWCFERA